MKIIVNNLYEHPEHGLFCLMVEDTDLRSPHSGAWHDAVIYVGPDGKMHTTTKDHWVRKFTQIPYYSGDDEAVISMIRRTNPGDSDLDFIRIFESWSEAEMDLTGHMLELAVGATILKLFFDKQTEDGAHDPRFSLTISTEDLQRVAQNWEIRRVPQAHSFTFEMEKSFPNEG